MRTEVREIPIVQREWVYIAKDGKEFSRQDECLRYEYSLDTDKPQVVATAIHSLHSFEGDSPAIIYHIDSEEDWNYLFNYVWERHLCTGLSWNKYRGPQDYIAIENDGGDYHETYTVYPLEEYLEDIIEEAHSYEQKIRCAIDDQTFDNC